MIELINPTYKCSETKYGDRFSETVTCEALVRLEPHIMKYRYASKEYHISVPWTYFVFSSYISTTNAYSTFWRTLSRDTFLNLYFSSSPLDDSFLFRAPISNINGGYLCFSGLTDNRSYGEEEKDFLLKSFSDFDESKYIQKFNDVYSVFTNGVGNNDYKFGYQVLHDSLLSWFCRKLNRKIDNWPKFFSVWQKLGEIPLDFWPSSNEEVAENYQIWNVNSVCQNYNLDNKAYPTKTLNTLVV